MKYIVNETLMRKFYPALLEMYSEAHPYNIPNEIIKEHNGFYLHLTCITTNGVNNVIIEVGIRPILHRLYADFSTGFLVINGKECDLTKSRELIKVLVNTVIKEGKLSQF